MRKFIIITLPIVTLCLFVFIMLSSTFFKKPRSDYDNVPKYIETTTKAIISENWSEAETNFTTLNSAWKIVLKRVQFSSERDEINSLNVNLARLKASILNHDKNSALLELSEAKEHWRDLGK